MIRPIVSPQNENFKNWKTLSTAKGIKKTGAFFLIGEKLIREFLRKPHFEILAEVMGPDHRSLLEGRAFDFIHKYQLPQALFDELDVIGTHFNLLLLKAPEFATGEMTPPSGLELVLPLGDPGNLGAALRSALAFGVKKVYLTEEASHPFHPKAVKSSAGAVLNISFIKTAPLKTLLLAKTNNLFALDLGGENMSKFHWPKNLQLVVGEEGSGLGAHQLPKITIPTQGVESLNAAVSVSLAGYAYKFGGRI